MRSFHLSAAVLSLLLLRVAGQDLDEKPGSCPADQVCATKASCPFWVDWENRVKDDRNSPEFQQYLTAAKGALCNKRERATCCWGDPLEVDVRLMFYACTYFGKVVAKPKNRSKDLSSIEAGALTTEL